MAFTEAKQFQTIMGDKIVGSYKLTADGSDTTWDAPVKALDFVAVSYSTGITGTTGTVSWSGSTVTFGNTMDSSDVAHVFFVGY